MESILNGIRFQKLSSLPLIRSFPGYENLYLLPQNSLAVSSIFEADLQVCISSHFRLSVDLPLLHPSVNAISLMAAFLHQLRHSLFGFLRCCSYLQWFFWRQLQLHGFYIFYICRFLYSHCCLRFHFCRILIRFVLPITSSLRLIISFAFSTFFSIVIALADSALLFSLACLQFTTTISF